MSHYTRWLPGIPPSPGLAKDPETMSSYVRRSLSAAFSDSIKKFGPLVQDAFEEVRSTGLQRGIERMVGPITTGSWVETWAGNHEEAVRLTRVRWVAGPKGVLLPTDQWPWIALVRPPEMDLFGRKIRTPECFIHVDQGGEGSLNWSPTAYDLSCTDWFVFPYFKPDDDVLREVLSMVEADAPLPVDPPRPLHAIDIALKELLARKMFTVGVATGAVMTPVGLSFLKGWHSRERCVTVRHFGRCYRAWGIISGAEMDDGFVYEGYSAFVFERPEDAYGSGGFLSVGENTGEPRGVFSKSSMFED